MKDDDKDEHVVPVLKELKKDKEDGKVDKDEIVKACEDKLSKEEVEEQLKKLED